MEPGSRPWAGRKRVSQGVENNYVAAGLAPAPATAPDSLHFPITYGIFDIRDAGQAGKESLLLFLDPRLTGNDIFR